MVARHLASFLQVRPGEAKRATLVAALFACIQAGQGIGGNVADALFFRRFGVEFLPVMFMILGVANFFAALSYAAGLGRFDKSRFFVALLLALAVVLVVERAAILLDLAVLYPILWITINAIGLIVGTLVWNVAGEVCDTRQAKRLFSLFASAGILGGVIGNLITGPLAKVLGTENLLALYAALLAVSLVLIREIARQFFTPTPGRARRASLLADVRAGFDFVRGSRLMQLIAVSSVLFSILFFSIAFPFSKVVSASYPDEAELAGFLGVFSSVVTAVTFLVSLFVANRLYARVGVVNAVLILVAIYLGGFVAWTANYSLTTAMAVRFAQLVVLGGVAGTAFNAFFNVVPPEKRGQVLAFNSGVPSQLGVILSGVLLILGERALTTTQIFIMGVVVALACAVVVWRMRREYGAALVAALRAGFLDVFMAMQPGLQNLKEDAQARQVALAGLVDPKPAVRRVSAEIAGRLAAREAIAPLARALDDPDAEVRHAALDALAQLEAREAADAIAARLTDPEPAIRAAAIDALAILEPQAGSRWSEALDDPHPRVRARAVVVAYRAGPVGRAQAALAALLDSTDPEERAAGLQACAETRAGIPIARLAEFLSDGDGPVRLAAVKALGAVDDPSAQAALVRALDVPDERVRHAAAGALQSADSALASIVDVLNTGSERAQESALVALNGHGAAAKDALLNWALAQIPRASEMRAWATALARVEAADIPRAWVFLRDLLRDREWQIEQRILSALALIGTPEAIGFIARGLKSKAQETRAQALEALDTLGDKRIVRGLIPLLEESVDAAGEDTRSVLDTLSRHPDGWFRALAVHATGELLSRDVRRWLTQARQDSEAIVREAAAAWAGVELPPHPGGGTMPETLKTLGTMDRILFLRQVPIFAHLAPEDLQRIAEIAGERVFSAGEYLCRDGEIGDEMFVIVEGQVRVTKQTTGETRTLRVLQAGQHIGELAALREQPRSANVMADASIVRALVIDGRALKAILRDRPEVALAMLTALAERLSTTV